MSDDERLQPLPELLVIDPDHGHLDDALVVGEQVLDLAREDVLATGDDHLIVAAVDEEAAVGVEVADVAAAEQAVDHLLVAAAGVALEGHLVADEDPADLTARDLPPRLVEEPNDGAVGGRPAVPGAARRSSGVATVANATSVEP